MIARRIFSGRELIVLEVSFIHDSCCLIKMSCAMAPRSLLPLLLALFYPLRVAAISATPNSPCASQCIDSSSLDPSDANSFTTTASDMICDDGDFSLSAVGQKWMSCMNCLQSSTFVQGDQNDQMWFLCMLSLLPHRMASLRGVAETRVRCR